MINVYIPNHPQEKDLCWSSLLTLQSSYVSPSCVIAGDFNTTLHPKEKKGGNIARDPLREKMKDLISFMDLADIKPRKCEYTWKKKHTGLGHIAAQLDRFLVSNSFLDAFLSCSSAIFPWGGSDHRPISLLIYELEDLGPISLKFNSLSTLDPSSYLISKTLSCWIMGSLVFIWE